MYERQECVLSTTGLTACLDLALGLTGPALGLIASGAGLGAVYLASTLVVLCAQALLAADIAHRAIDEAAHHLLLEGSGMGTIGLIPATTLGGRGMVAAIGAAVTLGANLDVDRALQHRQMAQPQWPVMAVGLFDLLPAAPASRPLKPCSRP
jgi:hypothetical protein